MAKLVGIDVGTSGCKSVLVDERGRLLKRASVSYDFEMPHPGWTQQNPLVWWDSVQECLRQMGEAHPSAIALTGQMHGSVFLNGNGEVLYPAILWNDQRTAEQCRRYEALIGRDRLMKITGNPALTGFQLGKILWLRVREPSIFAQVRKILLPKDYIRFRLSGEYATDVSDASGTGLLDLQARDWSEELCGLLDIDPELMPEVYESSQLCARSVGSSVLGAGVPIAAGAGDQAAAAVSTGAVEPGIVSISLGTSGVVFGAIDSPRYLPDGSAHTFCHANGGYHAMAVTLNCGAAVNWAHKTFFPDLELFQVDELARSAAGKPSAPIFLPYLNGERSPVNDPEALGMLCGLTLGTGRADLARSIFEGVSLSLYDAFDSLRELEVTADELRVTGGGTKSEAWLTMLANTFGRECYTLQVDDGAAFGAAILAGVGIGIWPDVASAARELVRCERCVVPKEDGLGPSRLAAYRQAVNAERIIRKKKTE